MKRIIRFVFPVILATLLGSPVSGEQGQNFRMAVIGLVHGHAWGHLRAIAQRTDLQLVGIADESEALRNEAAKEAPNVPLYADYRRLLTEEKPDAVWSFVENDRHVEITRACAERQIHVIFEKPMASTLAQAQEMLNVAHKSRIKLMVNYQMAWWPSNYAAYEFAESGQLGKVWRVRGIVGHGGPASAQNSGNPRRQASWEWINDESRGGGALIDFTCYGAVWLRWYLGLPSGVYAITTHTRPDIFKTNTHAAVLATFPDNRVGIIEGSWDLPRGFQDLEVFGNLGSVCLTGTGVEAYIGKDKKEVSVRELEPTRADPVSYFMNAVRNKQPIEGIVGAEFNLDVMKIVEAARLSAKSGSPVSLR